MDLNNFDFPLVQFEAVLLQHPLAYFTQCVIPDPFPFRETGKRKQAMYQKVRACDRKLQTGERAFYGEYRSEAGLHEESNAFQYTVKHV